MNNTSIVPKKSSLVDLKEHSTLTPLEWLEKLPVIDAHVYVKPTFVFRLCHATNHPTSNVEALFQQGAKREARMRLKLLAAYCSFY